jgi:prepilin-type N-terminal cleavage/methylation domain-containing protein
MQSRMKSGFTLIELLVVIAIIGLLASAVFASFAHALQLAKYSRAEVEIRTISNMMIMARVKTGQTTAVITGVAAKGTWCSEVSCRYRGNIQNLPKSDPCWVDYESAISKLNAASGNVYNLTVAPTDPWGAPYLINENEGEPGFPVSACYSDDVMSAGPNGVYFDTDDIVYNIIESNCSPIVGPHHQNMNWR